MVPQTFEEWKRCITIDCNIPLTQKFAAQRLAVLTNSEEQETKQFAERYGQEHLNNIIEWFNIIYESTTSDK